MFVSIQDDTNKDGGKWMIRLKKGISSRCWENLVRIYHTHSKTACQLKSTGDKF